VKILFLLLITLLALGSSGAWIAQYLGAFDTCTLVQPETPTERQQRQQIMDLQDALAAQEELATALNARLSERGERIERLTEIYARMEVARVAEVITQLEPRIAVRVFENMDAELVGQILNLLPAQQTVTYSRILSGLD